ncbi:MAG: hypothetical protein AAGC97_07130 [Planctomycetota bacterium]
MRFWGKLTPQRSSHDSGSPRPASGRGASRSQVADSILNFLTNRTRLLRDSIPGNAQDGKALCSQKSISRFVAPLSLISEMMFAINLDNQLQFQTNKVERVDAEWVLSTELLAKHPSGANHLPHIPSEFVGLLALVTGKLNSFLSAFLASFHSC